MQRVGLPHAERCPAFVLGAAQLIAVAVTAPNVSTKFIQSRRQAKRNSVSVAGALANGVAEILHQFAAEHLFLDDLSVRVDLEERDAAFDQ